MTVAVSAEDEVGVQSTLAWISDTPTPTVVRTYAERWVLAGWLAHPTVPAGSVASLLEAPQHQHLAETPLGAIIAARGSNKPSPPRPLADLALATELALQQAAADRDREQAEWATRKQKAITDLGSDDPISLLLERSRRSLTPSSVDDGAAGGALLSFAASRWVGVCPEQPCRGLDRVEMMQSAGTWSEEIAPLASVWRVVALKESLDTMDVGKDTVLFPSALIDLVDALLGTGGGPLDAGILRRRRPDSTVWLVLGRAVGVEGTVDWAGVREALGRHLLSETERALATIKSPRMRTDLERIRRRAIP